ncbi:methyl-accepting chemotaxis protein [Bdellovibrio bacteriovorus]
MTKWMRGLRGKLMLSAIIPIIALTAVTLISIRSTSKLGDKLETAYADIIPNMEALSTIGMQRARVGYFIWAALANKEDFESRKKFIKRASDAFDELKKGIATYEATGLDKEQEAIYAKAKELKPAFFAMTDEILKGLEKNNAEADAKIHKWMNGGEWHVMAIDIQASITGNMKLDHDRSIVNNKEQKDQRAFETQLLILLAGLCGFLVFGILTWMAAMISKTVSSIGSDLSQAGNQVALAINQLSSAGQTLSENSTDTAASLEETVASLEEMSSMVKMNSDNAKQAAALSQSSKEVAEKGQQSIDQLIHNMQDISKSSKQIEEIISVIDDIAFQTNLLALNASVEAARAGEHGKGFAVVAEAVRALAQRSASAAKDINTLIVASVEKVERGAKTADTSGEALANIVSSVKKVADLNNEISAASLEQTTGISQISKAMNQLDQGAQSNAASSEEVAASAEEINSQTQMMQKMVEKLNQMVEGSAPRHAESSEQKKSVAKKAAPKPTGAKAAEVKLAEVKPMPTKKPAAAAEIIPFDDDLAPRKVGTTDGF